jgi:hypothetical protein
MATSIFSSSECGEPKSIQKKSYESQKKNWDNFKNCSVDATFHTREFDYYKPLDLWHKRLIGFYYT